MQLNRQCTCKLEYALYLQPRCENAESTDGKSQFCVCRRGNRVSRFCALQTCAISQFGARVVMECGADFFASELELNLDVQLQEYVDALELQQSTCSTSTSDSVPTSPRSLSECDVYFSHESDVDESNNDVLRKSSDTTPLLLPLTSIATANCECNASLCALHASSSKSTLNTALLTSLTSVDQHLIDFESPSAVHGNVVRICTNADATTSTLHQHLPTVVTDVNACICNSSVQSTHSLSASTDSMTSLTSVDDHACANEKVTDLCAAKISAYPPSPVCVPKDVFESQIQCKSDSIHVDNTAHILIASTLDSSRESAPQDLKGSIDANEPTESFRANTLTLTTSLIPNGSISTCRNLNFNRNAAALTSSQSHAFELLQRATYMTDDLTLLDVLANIALDIHPSHENAVQSHVTHNNSNVRKRPRTAAFTTRSSKYISAKRMYLREVHKAPAIGDQLYPIQSSGLDKMQNMRFEDVMHTIQTAEPTLQFMNLTNPCLDVLRNVRVSVPQNAFASTHAKYVHEDTTVQCVSNTANEWLCSDNYSVSFSILKNAMLALQGADMDRAHAYYSDLYTRAKKHAHTPQRMCFWTYQYALYGVWCACKLINVCEANASVLTVPLPHMVLKHAQLATTANSHEATSNPRIRSTRLKALLTRKSFAWPDAHQCWRLATDILLECLDADARYWPARVLLIYVYAYLRDWSQVLTHADYIAVAIKQNLVTAADVNWVACYTVLRELVDQDLLKVQTIDAFPTLASHVHATRKDDESWRIHAWELYQTQLLHYFHNQQCTYVHPHWLHFQSLTLDTLAEWDWTNALTRFELLVQFMTRHLLSSIAVWSESPVKSTMRSNDSTANARFAWIANDGAQKRSKKCDTLCDQSTIVQKDDSKTHKSKRLITSLADLEVQWRDCFARKLKPFEYFCALVHRITNCACVNDGRALEYYCTLLAISPIPILNPT